MNPASDPAIPGANAESNNPNIEALTLALEKKIQSGQLEVPMLPEVAGRVVILSQDAESDALQLAQLIQSDQSLAGHVMRIANSAAYTPNASLVSLQQAITRLGMSLISEIALAASISSKMFNAPGYEQHISDIWRHALATALWSKEVARVCRRNVEAAFLCGLLHSIGRPVALQAILELNNKQASQLDREQCLQLEQRYHKRAGAEVIKRWGMPKIVSESIAYFDDYSKESLAGDPAKIITAGAHFATHQLTPDALSSEALLQKEVLADLNLYGDEVDLLMDKQEFVIQAMEDMSL